MNVDIFTLCDFATTDASGKMNILGSFDRIYIQQVPTIIPMCALAIKIRFTQIEDGVKRIRISFMNEDGQLIVPRIEAQMQIIVAPNEITSTAQMVMVVPQLRLQNFGDYSIVLAVGEMEAASCPLCVRQVPVVPPLQQPPPPRQPT
jgi:hypothetical protein